MSHQTLKEEIHRVKMLYRDIIDLDNGGVEIKADIPRADKALDDLINRTIAHTLSQVDEDKKVELMEHYSGKEDSPHTVYINGIKYVRDAQEAIS